ncbi:MAG: hypothetical protein Q7V31_10430 [Parvibaculum sp.]|uniref:hypothetical protein n=1 Tax=Parvibaculum sp. TaxID=2024848 RepID=UPI002722A38D|nr:hypothetical protein [Parvibaculum sp.]MDO8839334.1 hypothetical protein [Parvibaculum sp.]MDP2149264.1 hypothetical protein [Parvibaculum sp.]
MTEPRSRTAILVKGYMEFISPRVEFHESAVGRAWHWDQVGAQGMFISTFCVDGIFCPDNGRRFDADFLLWASELERVIVVVFDLDLTIFEPTTLEGATRFIRAVRHLPSALQQSLDAHGKSNRNRKGGGPNPFS